ncbi:MAG: hydrolase 2, exosortase A system-associated [Colwellia sp.]|uniref:hydrolase 2, exosortase A system-associated n=1 Tax=Colwellia sp. TaxID=56799 RepID=UPI001D54C5F2|nr:hydrolase 2, exosortase A system-associated [Colwellia sp.]NQY48704.1 hydrolase 2, exosortase A system-associated [Colwellia sp.]
MISTHVEFYQGTKGSLFRIIRTPEHVLAHLLCIAPLFEQANQTRHHITRSAINGYHQGLQTIVYDHYGTGDSGGELVEANLSLWQQDIQRQIEEIKANSAKAIYLSLPLSAVLLLSDEMLSLVDGLILLQPDFNGKRFVQQFKRLALAAKLTQADKKNPTEMNGQENLEIAGYTIDKKLLEQLAGQNLSQLTSFNVDCYWFEWLAKTDELSPGRLKQQQALANKANKLIVQQVAAVKFWQATELQLSAEFLAQEQIAFSQLLSHSAAIS